MSASVFGDLRDVCRCGHVRGSHRDRVGKCVPRSKTACACQAWSPAVAVWEDGPPNGVEVVRLRVRDHSAIVLCHHPPEARVARVGYSGDICTLCRVMSFDRPVKLLAYVDPPTTLFA